MDVRRRVQDLSEDPGNPEVPEIPRDLDEDYEDEENDCSESVDPSELEEEEEEDEEQDEIDDEEDDDDDDDGILSNEQAILLREDEEFCQVSPRSKYRSDWRSRNSETQKFYPPERQPPIMDFLTMITAFLVAVFAAYYTIST